MNFLRSISVFLCFLAAAGSHGQNIAINNDGSAPDASAMLDVSSTTRGLLIPRMRLIQRNALVNPAPSLLIYQTDNSPGYYYNAGSAIAPVWTQVGSFPLSDVLATGNDAMGDSIFNLNMLGIGTNNPSSPLNVKQIVPGTASDGAFIDIQNGSGTVGAISGVRFKNNSIDGNVRYNAAVFHRLNSSSDYQLNFAVRLNALGNIDTSDIKMTINDNGNVGIGTSSPAYNLDVNGSARVNNLRVNTPNLQFGASMEVANRMNIIGAGNPALFIGPNGSNYVYLDFVSASGYGRLFTPGTNDIAILAGGNVGIGTTNPSSELEVTGDIEIPAANDYTYSTAKTRYTSIPPSAFVSVRPESYELNPLGVISYFSIGGTGGSLGWASAPINTIPNGARITRITYYYYDNDATLNLSVALLRTPNLTTGGVIHASFTSNNNSTAWQSGTSNTNLPITVDYQNNYYQIYLTGRQGNSDLRLKNVVIEYTVTEAD